MSALPVDGMVVIMNRMPADFGTFEPLPGMQTVLVTMLEHPLCSTVDNDQFDCSRQVVEYLLEQGHKTVHFISCPERSLSGMQREEGWRETLRAHGIELPRLIRGDWTAQSGYAAGQALADDPTCTAIYASNDAMAYGCIRGLESRGRRVPEDVSVVGVDDSLGDIVPDRRLTTVRFDNRRVGMWQSIRSPVPEGGAVWRGAHADPRRARRGRYGARFALGRGPVWVSVNHV